MFGKEPVKETIFQSPEEKIYLLKLIAHQKLGEKWIYYRKIKRGDSGLKVFKESSLMEQMKATRAALKFTTKNARKLYRTVYLNSLKEIKSYTGLKTDFPDLPEIAEGESLPSLNSDQDAVIISWTPLKFLLPVSQLRAKGLATQRHTEGLSAKLFFKVAGYYADPANWDQFKLNFYLRRISKNSTYQEIVQELEPLKSDLEKFTDSYELFKFGKASLSKDIAAESDTFDDAMGVESFESQLENLYWYHFIYLGIELFLFRYYLVLITSARSKVAIRYLTSLFEPVLGKAIENRIVFLGSFEVDRSKRTFRVPYIKRQKAGLEAPSKKSIKTQMGVFETHTYHLPMLESSAINHELAELPNPDSPWWNLVKHHILNIGKPSVLPTKKKETPEKPVEPSAESDAIKQEKVRLQQEKEKLIAFKKDLISRKNDLEEQKKSYESFEKAEKIEYEEKRSKLLKDELQFDQVSQKLKEQYKNLEKKLAASQVSKKGNGNGQDLLFPDVDSLIQYEKELAEPELRQYVLMNIMTTMVNCNQSKRVAKYQILERFKSRVKNDRELEQKRIEELEKNAEKKLRSLKQRQSKMARLKQSETVKAVSSDIEDFERGVKERIYIIKQDSQTELKAQKERLNNLFQDISKEKSVDLGTTSRILWELALKITPENVFFQTFPQTVAQNIQDNYSRELEPFYTNLFNILDLSIPDKILMIQSLEKSSSEHSLKLSLNEDEEREFQNLLVSKKEALEKQMPDLFSSKVIFLTKLIIINDLLKLSLDNKSLNALLLLKIASAKTTQKLNLSADIIKGLLELNTILHPIPKNRIIQQGREQEKNPEKRINSSMLNKILDNLEN